MSDEHQPEHGRTGATQPARPTGSTEPTGSPRGQATTFWPEDHEPTRADYVCLTLIGLSGLYGLGVMLARPVLLGYDPLVLAGLSGSRSALVTIGAQHAVGQVGLGTVLLAFVIASISYIKLDLLFWWAGRLWGSFFVEQLVGDSKRKARQAARAESWARRYSVLAILVGNIPVLPIPKGIIFAVLGVSGTSFRKVLALDLLFAAIVEGLWLYLGYTIGEPVVQVVEVIARYSLWITLAIFAVMLVGAWWKAQRRGAAAV